MGKGTVVRKKELLKPFEKVTQDGISPLMGHEQEAPGVATEKVAKKLKLALSPFPLYFPSQESLLFTITSPASPMLLGIKGAYVYSGTNQYNESSGSLEKLVTSQQEMPRAQRSHLEQNDQLRGRVTNRIDLRGM